MTFHDTPPGGLPRRGPVGPVRNRHPCPGYPLRSVRGGNGGLFPVSVELDGAKPYPALAITKR